MTKCSCSERTLWAWLAKWGGRKVDCEEPASSDSQDCQGLESHFLSPSPQTSTAYSLDALANINSTVFGRPDSPVLGWYDENTLVPRLDVPRTDDSSRAIASTDAAAFRQLQLNADPGTGNRSDEPGVMPTLGWEDGMADLYSHRIQCVPAMIKSSVSDDSGYISSTTSLSSPIQDFDIFGHEDKAPLIQAFAGRQTTNEMRGIIAPAHGNTLAASSVPPGHDLADGIRSDHPPHLRQMDYLDSFTGCSDGFLLPAHLHAPSLAQGGSSFSATWAHIASMANASKPEYLHEQLQLHSRWINNRDNNGNALVHFVASSKPSLRTLQIFDRAGATMSVINHKGETILHVLDATFFQDVKDLSVLLQWCEIWKVPMRHRTVDGQTVLHNLVRHMRGGALLECLEEFFSRHFIYMTTRDSAGETPLDIMQGACGQKPVRPISDAPETFQQLRAKQHDMLRLVRESLGRPWIEDDNGRNAISCLAYISDLDPQTRIHFLEKMLKRGIDVNHYDKDGYTPLHCFMMLVRYPDPEVLDEQVTLGCVRILLKYGADVKLRDRAGNTALHLACRHGRLLCVHQLLLADSLVNVTNDAGRTVISEARSWLPLVESNMADRIQEAIARIARFGGLESPV